MVKYGSCCAVLTLSGETQMPNVPKSSPASSQHNSARRRLDRKEYKEAEHYILQILRKDINDHVGLAMLAELNVALGKYGEAAAYCMMAIKANPSILAYKEKLIELAGTHPVAMYEELTEYAVLECLKAAETLDCTAMQTLWYSHLLHSPEFHAAYGLVGRKLFDPANKDFFEKIANFKPLFSPYFLLGIKNIVVENALFEEFITHLRWHLLSDLGENKKFTPDESIVLASALSHYSFYTDYILDCTEEEQKKIDALRTDIETGRGEARDVALFACYEPLYALKNAADIAARFAATPEMASVIKMQITDHQVLRETAASVVAITPVDDSVSAKVQEQYEVFPYPRWKAISPAGVISGWKAVAKNEKMTAGLRCGKSKILIAGCGTGMNAIMFAIIFPEAEILAVDLSRSSLTYAINKAKEYDIRNITFRQADILRLDTLEQKFDLIVSVGVLHHMKDPAQGWKVLCGLLKPEGVMRIGLYSRMGRAAVIKACDVIRKNGYANDAGGMRFFRRESAKLLEKKVLENLSHFSDYYYLSAYRDLLFHVQEYNYDLQEIEELLAAVQLEFIDFANSVQEVDRGAAGSVLQAWHLFEQKNPDAFSGMYIFWCRKS